MGTKRLRVFAGPNGSGKSTITKIVKEAGVHVGVYDNADDLKRSINDSLRFDFSSYLEQVDMEHFWKQFEDSLLFERAEGKRLRESCRIEGSAVCFSEAVNDYFTSFLAGYLREALLDCCEKIAFETVMSHPSKLDYIRRAREKGFRIYLYFVSLEDPELNKIRVASRVVQGGHDVPEEKITERYERCMELLYEAILLADRAFFFDNSASSAKLLATVENGELSFVEGVEYMPGWFKRYVIDKLA